MRTLNKEVMNILYKITFTEFILQQNSVLQYCAVNNLVIRAVQCLGFIVKG